MGIDYSDDAICARGGWYPDFKTRPSAPAIYQTTAFDMHSLEQLEAVAGGRETGYIYTRDGNPNHDAFCAPDDLLRASKAPKPGWCAAAGMGAMTAALLGACPKTGDRQPSSPPRPCMERKPSQLLNHLQSSFGVTTTYVDATRPEEFARAVTAQTKLAVVETISNPLMEVADLPAIVAALGEVPLLVDSTFATPCLARPLEHGARLVFHSASKYLNGHGDVMLGVIVGKRDSVRKVRGMAALYGLNSNPFECWLASRGLRTLPLRMQRVSQTAAELARFLAGVKPRV